MRVSVNERVKEAPAQALRAMFAGIGQLMSVSDKLRNKAAATRAPAEAASAAQKTATPETVSQETVTPEAAAPKAAAPQTTEAPEPAVPEPVAPANGAGGHVKLLSPEETPATAATAAAPAAPATTVAPDATSGAAAAAELPLANYDDLSIASLRARLRNLTAGQLDQLVAYEKSHAARADVISMFERRIAKLAEG